MELDIPVSADGEAKTDRKRGGWITFPFLMVTSACLTLGNTGWVNNLIVYLISDFNVKSIEATQIYNIVNGFINLSPILGAIVADSYLGCFSVIWISSFVCLLGTILLTLSAAIDSLRPQPCETGSSSCPTPSKIQFGVLYVGLALASLGLGSTRYTMATMGANQLPSSKDKGVFFNWYFFGFFTAGIVGNTAVVYVEDNVSWGWGFGLCSAASALGLAVFLLGSRFYLQVQAEGSPFTALARVVVASIRKRKVPLSVRSEDYYCGRDGNTKMATATPTNSFRFLNRAALRTEGDIRPDGSISKPWKLCTLQQVEDLKTLIRIFPLWSTGIFLGIPIGIQLSLAVLQALTMDRHLGPHFQIPAGSILVFEPIFVCIGLFLFDRLIRPFWRKLRRRSPTPLQLIGVGHVLNVAGMAVSAIVETKRRNVARTAAAHHQLLQGGGVAPISAFWLVPQLAFMGVAASFHFPGQVALYYQEFPSSLKSMSTAVIGLIAGISFYLSTAVIGCVRRVTGWLPDNINDGKVDYVFWMLVAVGVANFGYYLVCAILYKYRNLETEDGGST
ncbi:hypothetical protein U1Q18_033177 [Sarracenia purpurea var. burkii]